MAVLQVALDTDTSQVVKIVLMTDVKNVPELRSKVMAGTLQCCFIKPSLITDPIQIVIAANKAALKNKYSSIITKTIYTEILFNLSISKKITQSLNLFGSSDEDTSILVVVLEKSTEDSIASVLSHVEGQQVDIDQLKQQTDEHLVKTTYGIKEQELQVSSLTDSIISRIAAKDILIGLQHD